MGITGVVLNGESSNAKWRGAKGSAAPCSQAVELKRDVFRKAVVKEVQLLRRLSPLDLKPIAVAAS
jgi:hypothetical protein